jgi:hypothetical protein
MERCLDLRTEGWSSISYNWRMVVARNISDVDVGLLWWRVGQRTSLIHNWRMGVQFSENCGYGDAAFLLCCIECGGCGSGNGIHGGD